MTASESLITKMQLKFVLKERLAGNPHVITANNCAEIIRQHEAEQLHAQSMNISPERVQGIENFAHDEPRPGEISGIDVEWLADQFFEKGKQYSPAPSHYLCEEFAKIVQHVLKHSRYETAEPVQESRGEIGAQALFINICDFVNRWAGKVPDRNEPKSLEIISDFYLCMGAEAKIHLKKTQDHQP